MKRFFLILDPEKPVIFNTSNPISVDVDTRSGARSSLVTWIEPSVTDNSGIVSMTSDFSPGDKFFIGQTPVTYTAVDPFGNNQTYVITVIIYGMYIMSIVVFTYQIDIWFLSRKTKLDFCAIWQQKAKTTQILVLTACVHTARLHPCVVWQTIDLSTFKHIHIMTEKMVKLQWLIKYLELEKGTIWKRSKLVMTWITKVLAFSRRRPVITGLLSHAFQLIYKNG